MCATASLREFKEPTDWAVQCGAWVNGESGEYNGIAYPAGGSGWWLRSPGRDAVDAASVGASGIVFSIGYSVDSDGIGVRPAVVVYPEGAAPEAAGSAGADVVDEATGLPVIEFGSYRQNSPVPEPIEWLVLDEHEDGTSLLLSRYALECRPYNEERVYVSWETCDLRAWLNGEFLEEAFSVDERARIVETWLENADNSSWDTEGGADTNDRAFLLSISEIMDYFGVVPNGATKRLIARPTNYTVHKGVTTYNEKGALTYNDGTCYWWLRSPGMISDCAAYVSATGALGMIGNYVDDVDSGVRPALVVKL